MPRICLLLSRSTPPAATKSLKTHVSNFLGLIYPNFLLQNTDFSFDWIEINEVGLWADIPSLTYSFEPLEPGTEFVAELWVFDYGGNSDYVYVEDIIP